MHTATVIRPYDREVPTKVGEYDDTILLDSGGLEFLGGLLEALADAKGPRGKLFDDSQKHQAKLLKSAFAEVGLENQVPYGPRHGGGGPRPGKTSSESEGGEEERKMGARQELGALRTGGTHPTGSQPDAARGAGLLRGRRARVRGVDDGAPRATASALRTGVSHFEVNAGGAGFAPSLARRGVACLELDMRGVVGGGEAVFKAVG